MGALMKEITAKFGGRGGGSKDMAQGGLPGAEALDAALKEIAQRISAH
jgi:alanyl-tRNA synthetase